MSTTDLGDAERNDSATGESQPEPMRRVAGRYLIESMLGRGGFGTVYDAIDELEHRRVALKVIRRDRARDGSGTASPQPDLGAAVPGSGAALAHIEQAAADPVADLESNTARPPDNVSNTGPRGSLTADAGDDDGADSARQPLSARAVPRSSSISPVILGRSSRTRSSSLDFHLDLGAVSTPSDDLTAAFKEEFRLLTQLHHPSLASVYDFGTCSELEGVYFTQELIDGENLVDFVETASREQIVELFLQLGHALDYLHALGLIHGDIKPSNVLVIERDDGQFRAKLIDFGLARMMRNGARRTRDERDPESASLVMGTPGFSAPERIRGNAVDARSDIYSLAATMYAVITGRRPFPARNFEDCLLAQIEWRSELAGALLDRAGESVAELVGRMLHPDPDQRPQSARSVVLELLRRESVHLGSSARHHATPRSFARMLVEQLPFADRGGHLELLLTRATQILLPAEATQDRHRPAHTIVLEAPDGMGKRRLVTEFRREIQLAGGLFIQSSLWTNANSPLGPFPALISQLATALGPDSQTVRKYRGLVAMTRGRIESDDVAQQLMEFFLAAARERPFVLHLSHLSRSGPQFFHFELICRAIARARAPIFVCVSTDPHNKLSSLLEQLAGEHLLERLRLRPFSRDEMFATLEGVLGPVAILDELVDDLEKRTGGHPLSFRETVRVLIEESILVREGDEWVLRLGSAAAADLDAPLVERSTARIDNLGRAAWHLVCLLLLIEEPIDEQTLRQLTKLAHGRFERTLERLQGEGLVNRVLSARTSYVSLAHDSVRQAVRDRYGESLNATRESLANQLTQQFPEHANYIYLSARLRFDATSDASCVSELESAARKLLSMGQHQYAAAIFERIIERLRRSAGANGLQRLLAAQRALLIDCSGSLADRESETRHFEAAILVAELCCNLPAQAEFWLGLANAFAGNRRKDAEKALEHLARAGSCAVEAGDRILQLKIENRRADLLLTMGATEAAEEHSHAAMTLLSYPDATDGDICSVVGVRLRCLSLVGRVDEASELHAETQPIAARTPVLQRLGYLSGAAFLAVFGGEPERAIPELESAIEELRHSNASRQLTLPLHNLGDLQLRSGDLEAARRSFRSAARLSSVYGLEQQIHLNHGFLGYTIARLGDPREGAMLLAEARRSIVQTSGEQVSLQQLRILDAEVAHMNGQTARARRELEEMCAEYGAQHELSLARWASDALRRIETDLRTGFIESRAEPADEYPPEIPTVQSKPVKSDLN